MKKNKKFVPLILLLISIAGFALVTLLWPKNEKLPVLGKVSDIQLEEVHANGYQLNNEKVKILAFFYTRCPDFCPLTMADFSLLQEQLKKEDLLGDKVELISLSFDPENDTREVIQSYAKSFQADTAGWKWLRGTEEETAKIAKELQMQYTKVEGDFFSHSTTMYLIDNKNQVRALYDMASRDKPVDREKILVDIRYLIHQE
ncbi:SCO family protein [Pueribacillus theae]|uniref:SCO family protein n=1 Tax=Pueribacillus theae TaxID=2171751 RepID=A0A2U1JY55_9BACI|nr:SCO family protein [Pueribacillus theae]PWA09738.1 SCO family protein [Pueribacillus theae]